MARQYFRTVPNRSCSSELSERTARSGFTLVELLIVIVVIAILAAITIVAYGGVTQKATAAALQSDLTQSKSWLDSYFVQNGSYPADLPTAQAAGLKVNPSDNLVYVANNAVNPATYALTASGGSQSYYVNNSTATKPTSGAWVQNLVSNPGLEAGTAGWVGQSGGVGVASATAHSGTKGISVTTPGAAAGEGVNAPISGVTAGSTYTGSAWVIGTSGEQLRLTLDEYSDTTYLAQSTVVFTATGVWQRVSLSRTVVSGNGLRLGVRTAGTSAYSYSVDDAMITQGVSLYDYADGSSSGWSWDGSPNASSSEGPAS